MLLPFDTYKDYGGKLEEAAYSTYSYEAEQKIKAAAFGRVKVLTEPVGRLIARLTDILAESDISKEKVTSWSNDGVSESYGQVSQQDVQQKIDSLIRTYLADEVDENGTPLLYLGVSHCD